jgi:hypothetical protein
MADELPSETDPNISPARVFVLIELLLWLGGWTVGGLWALITTMTGHAPWYDAVIMGGIIGVAAMQLSLILMFYRMITYLIGFKRMADLLDTTRKLLQSLFSPANANSQPPSPR